MITYNVVQGEYNTLTLTITDEDAAAVNVSGAGTVLEMWGKKQLDGSTEGYLFQKTTTDFTKNVGGTNIVTVKVNVNWYGTIFAIFKATISATNIKKGVFGLKATRSPE